MSARSVAYVARAKATMPESQMPESYDIDAFSTPGQDRVSGMVPPLLYAAERAGVRLSKMSEGAFLVEGTGVAILMYVAVRDEGYRVEIKVGQSRWRRFGQWKRPAKVAEEIALWVKS